MDKAVNLSQIGLYNPQRQSAELAEKLFVVRQKQFESLIESLNEEAPDSIPQHHLILAQRGMGKTTMLKRIEVELHKEQSRDKFIPVLFTEEQYGLNNLAKFWENCLDALANSFEVEDKNSPDAAEIDNYLNQIKKEKNTDNLTEKLYQHLLTVCNKIQRRPVLLVDNIGLVFNRLSTQEQHTLRAYISDKSCPVIVSAGVAMAGNSDAKEHVVDYRAPFYDFFQTHYLRKLSYEEFEELLQNLSKVTQTNITITSKEKSRLKSLFQLAGGNPRTSVMLFKLLVKGFSENIIDDLEALADEMTPLYKARFEELSPQQQQILYAIALNWDSIRLEKIHEDTGLANNQLSPQLKRLVEDGWLETTKAFKTKGNAYSIPERFFSIWNLMRNGNRRQKEQISCLSKFLECFYGKEELEKMSDTLLEQDICSSNQMLLHLAVMNTPIKKSLRDKISEKAFKTLIENETLSKEFDFTYEKFVPVPNKDSGNYNSSFKNKKEEKIFNQGVKLYKEEKYEEAIICFEKVIEINPENVKAYLNRGVAKSGLGDKQAAIDDYSKAIEINPNYAVAYYNRGVAKYALGEYQAAIDDYNKAIEINPNYAAAYFNRGVAKSDLGEYQAAIDDYNKSIEINPIDAATYFCRGYTKSALGDKQAAIDDYSKAIEINPIDAAAYFFRGVAKSGLGDKQAAIDDYSKAIEINPNYAAAYFFRGVAKSDLGDYQSAIDDYSKAIEINPNFAAAYFFRGVAKSGLGDKQAAIDDYSKSIEINPDNECAYFRKAECLLDLEQYEEAIQYYDKAIKLDANYQVAWSKKGYTLMEMGHYEEAALAYEKSIAVYPQGLLSQFHLLYLYNNKLGKKKEAIELFNSIDENEIKQNEDKKLISQYYIHKSIFELDKHNEGLAKEYLLLSFEILEKEGKIESIANDYCWKKFGSVVIQSGYGSWLLAVLEEKNYDIVLSPYYTAIQALEIERTENAETAEIYLRNQAVEKSEPARVIMTKMKKYW